jgi:hypothetical protein
MSIFDENIDIPMGFTDLVDVISNTWMKPALNCDLIESFGETDKLLRVLDKSDYSALKHYISDGGAYRAELCRQVMDKCKEYAMGIIQSELDLSPTSRNNYSIHYIMYDHAIGEIVYEVIFEI